MSSPQLGSDVRRGEKEKGKAVADFTPTCTGEGKKGRVADSVCQLSKGGKTKVRLPL